MTREGKIALAGVIATIAAFAIGFGWQYSRARDAQQQLEIANADITFERLEGTIAAATIEAERTNYTVARQLTSDFFSGLQSQMLRAPEERRADLQRILSLRDNAITAASRNDPMTGSLLSQIYSAYRVTFGKTPLTPIPQQ